MSKKLLSKINSYLEEKPSKEDLLKFIEKAILQDDPANRTIANRYSKVKKHLNENYDFFTMEFLKKVKPSDKIIEKILAEDSERRSNKQNITFTKDDVDKILSFSDTNSLPKLVSFLMFSSGMRINEILDEEFKLTRVNNSKNLIHMNGLSKQTTKRPVKIELIEEVKPSLFKALLKLIRTKKESLEMSINDINAKVNKFLKQNFKSFKSSHNLRGAYAQYLYHQSGKKQNINGFITKHLNHSSDDASLNYSNFIYKE